jgi:molybdopterin-guanine dinucleotide biosynthesis protein A
MLCARSDTRSPVPGSEAGELVSDASAVGVRSRGLPEPLLCLLHRRVLPVVELRLAAGRYKASGLLTDEGLAIRWIDDADPRALRNVNSPEDL